MKPPKVIPASTAAEEFRARATPKQRQVLVPVAGPLQEIDDLADDYQRALFCRKQAESYRRHWFAGREREIAYVMERAYAGDARFRRMTVAQLEKTARWRWSQSAYAQYFSRLEKTYSEWAHMYLAFAEVQVLNRGEKPAS
jgi:hypothetical protein